MCFAPDWCDKNGETVWLHLTHWHDVASIGINCGAVELTFLGLYQNSCNILPSTEIYRYEKHEGVGTPVSETGTMKVA